MSVTILDIHSGLDLPSKKVELVRHNGKYYIELEEFDGMDSIVELSIALTQENEALKEQIDILKQKISLLEAKQDQ